jgi:hypothetical protein
VPQALPLLHHFSVGTHVHNATTNHLHHIFTKSNIILFFNDFNIFQAPCTPNFALTIKQKNKIINNV